MAQREDKAAAPAPAFSDADKARARQWFKKAADCRERRDYDYAIECFVTGLGQWPEAVEEGHMPLRSLAVQRQQVGGKEPGLREKLKHSTSGKDAKQNLLNAEHLLAMDPANGGYADAALKNASKAGFLQTCGFLAPIVLETLKRDKKPNKARFAAYRQALVEAAEQAAQRGEGNLEAALLEQAVSSLDYLMTRLVGDEDVRNELRDLAGKLTIARGKYEQAEDFRESLQDAKAQKLLHDSERVHQGEDTLEALITAARAAYEEQPESATRVNAYVDVLLRSPRKRHEDEAIGVLLKAYAQTRNYSFKVRADDQRLRALERRENALKDRAQDSKSPDDQQQARLAALERRQTAVEILRERVEKYPTDLRARYRLGHVLFESEQYDEAIPMLQAALQDPRTRSRCQLLLGRAFFEKGAPQQAVALLREALERSEVSDDDAKRLLYWLGRSSEAAGELDEAKSAYGRLLRQDYNYMNGDARKRFEALK